MKILCNMGIPMGLQYSITAIGSVILQTSVNSLGSMAVASVTAGSKISMFFCCPFDALGSTMATYGGQNVGARKLDRIDKGLKAGTLIGCIYAVAAFAVLLFMGQWVALMFVDPGETEILKNTQLFLIANSLHSASGGQCGAVHDTGPWVSKAGNPGRCLRDGGPFLCGLLPGTPVWLPGGLYCQPGGVDCG